MKIQQINPSNFKEQPTFGHTFKVSICVRESENSAYQFVHPITDYKLYKNLVSRLVGWLNMDYLARMREQSGKILKKPARLLSERDIQAKKLIMDLLKWLDTDYKKHPQVRSVYTDDGLGYLATGKNINEIKEECDAGKVGITKHDAIQIYKSTRTPEVANAVSSYKKKSIDFVRSLKNLLRSPNSDRELMLRLNFIQTGTKGRKPVYEFDNCDFYAIKSSVK